MNQKLPRLILCSFLLFSLGMFPQLSIANGWQCWAEASVKYKLPVRLLYAISRVESGNKAHKISGHNKNGSYDIGLMQINSNHLPMLQKYGITEYMLLQDPCLNLHTGAWILASSVYKYGFNWRGIGAYNANSDAARVVYAKKVIAEYNRIENKNYQYGYSDSLQ